METELSYSEAFKQLEKLAEELEDGNIPLDELTENVKHANELMLVCEVKLRKIETDLQGALRK